MKLRASFEHQVWVVRSVGDQPNGTVGYAAPDGRATLTIDSHYEPSPEHRLELSVAGINPAHSTPISSEAAVEACDGVETLRHLLNLTTIATLRAIDFAFSQGRYDEARSAVDLCEEVQRAAQRRLERERREG